VAHLEHAVAAAIFTNDATDLGQRLSGDVSKSSAIEFSQSAGHSMTDISLGEEL
jgi:hypothetical protein